MPVRSAMIPVPARAVDQGEGRSGGQRPDRGDPDRLADRVPVAGTDGAADQRLRGVGEPVQGVGGEDLEIEQDRVGGKRHIAQPRALGSEIGEGEDKDRSCARRCPD